MLWVETDGVVNQSVRQQTVGQKCVISMMMGKPVQNALGLGMENKFSAFKPHCCIRFHAPTSHHPYNIFHGEMLNWLLPDGAMAATRLTCRSGINHQLAQLFVMRTKEIVSIQKSACHVIFYFVHTFCVLYDIFIYDNIIEATIMEKTA